MERECKHHGITEFHFYGNKQWKCKRCVGEAVSRRQRKVKAILIEEAGGRCQRCGYDKYQGALHFHHRDRSTKSFNVQSGTTKSLEKMRAEAAKCDLLCANCHAEVEYESHWNTIHKTQARPPKPPRVCSCGKILSHNGRCIKCHLESREKIQWPPTEKLIEMVSASNFVAVGRELGVSDNAIRKRISNHPV